MFFGTNRLLGPSSANPPAPLTGQLQPLQRRGVGVDQFAPIRTVAIVDSGSSDSDDEESGYDRDSRANVPTLNLFSTAPLEQPLPRDQGAFAMRPTATPTSGGGTPLTPRRTASFGMPAGRSLGRVGSGALVALGMLQRGTDSCPGTPRRSPVLQPEPFLEVDHHDGEAKARERSGSPRAKPCWRVIVIGPPRSGKSSFINDFRAVTTHSDKWPVAPVGTCGKYGTTSVDPFPNRLSSPSWLLIDTPGRLHADLENDMSDDSILLSRLFDGVPWKTRLVGSGALPMSEVSALEAVPSHRPHHCVITIAGHALVKDMGFMQRVWLRPRFVPADHSKQVVEELRGLVTKVRDLLGDRAPVVVITHWDLVCGRTPSLDAVKAALQVLDSCIPAGRCYFVSVAAQQSTALSMSSGHDASSSVHHQLDEAIDAFSRKEMLRLHRDVTNDVLWVAKQQKGALIRRHP
jgi:hypothetical protein